MYMVVIALSRNKQVISVNEFFAKYSEFSCNENLASQTARVLKLLLRHPDAVEDIAYKIDGKYVFSVFGVNRTYSVSFEINKTALVLIDIW